MPTARFCFGLTNDVFSSLKVVDVRWDPSDYNDGMHTPAKLKGCEIARGTTKTWALEVNKNANSANFTLTVEVDNQTTFTLDTDPREQVQKDIPDASPVHVESKAQDPPIVYANMKPGWGGGGLVEYVVSRTKPVNLQTWMTEMWDTIKDVPLWQVAIPSSHDSLSLDGAARGGLPEDSRSATQGLKTAGQLEAGVRCFDLRLRFESGNWHGYHGADFFENGPDLDEVFGNIRTFLDRHPDEIVLLLLRLDGGDKTSALQHLIDLLGADRIVGKKFVAKHAAHKTPAAFTPGELSREKKQVIILWDEDEDVGRDHDLLWWKASDYTQITRAENDREIKDGFNRLVEGRTRDLDWWANNYREMQSAPDHAPYWWALGLHTTHTFALGGLKKGASESVPVMVEKLRTTWRGKPVNLAGADLFTLRQYHNFARAVIALNRQFTYEPLLERPSTTSSATENKDGAWAGWSLTAQWRAATGIEVRNQDKYGLIDARVLYDTYQSASWSTQNGDQTSYSAVQRTDDPIVKVVLKEQDGYGLIDLQFTTASGYESDWLVGNPAEGRVHEILVPSHQLLVGLQGRQQGGYGLVDLRLGVVERPTH